MPFEQLSKKVYMKELKKALNLKQICGNEDSLLRWVIAPDVNRPGLELTGFQSENDLRRVVIIGNKEITYIKTLTSDIKRQRFDSLTDGLTPCIIISGNEKCPDELYEIANQKNFPIFSYPAQSYDLVVSVVSFLSEKLAKTEVVYGVMLNIFGVGVLLQGHSGIGKSELALELIKRGHLFIADDRVDISLVHNDLICQAPDILKKMLEIRGVGILNVNTMFGGNCYQEKSKLDLIINLVENEDFDNINRVEPDKSQKEIIGISKPFITVPVYHGKAMGTIVEATVTHFMLKKDGIDMFQEFSNNLTKLINENKENQ